MSEWGLGLLAVIAVAVFWVGHSIEMELRRIRRDLIDTQQLLREHVIGTFRK